MSPLASPSLERPAPAAPRSDVPRAAIDRRASLLARMQLGPAWQGEPTPLLGLVPEALWGDYATWLFAAPQRFLANGEAERYGGHVLRHLEELARWVERNLGSAAVRAALHSYLSTIQPLPLTVSGASLQRHAELHGRILAAASGARRAGARPAGARADRKLRVAFVASHAAAIPSYFRLLDPARFEVSTFALEGVDDAAENGSDIAVSAILSLLRSDGGSQKCRQLPAALALQMADVAEIAPDVIVYAEDLSLSSSPLAQLAAQRLAPLQLVVAPGSVSTGLASIDGFALGETAFVPALAGQFTERLIVVPGSGQLLADLPETDASAAKSRATLPIAADACVLMTVARLLEITPEKMTHWAELLRRLPDAVLVIQLLQSAEVPFPAIEALGAEWDACLTAAGVAPQRGLILAAAVNSLADLQHVIAAADVFVDAGAFGEPDLLHVPLALGVPVVAREGTTLRTNAGAALLRSLGLDAGVARDEAHFQGIVAALAHEPARRADVATRQRTALERLPLCRDGLAAAETLGHALTLAYDELHALGARKFRNANPLVLAASTGDIAAAMLAGAKALHDGSADQAMEHARSILGAQPAHAAARSLAGHACLALGQFGRAVEYFLAVVQTRDTGVAWFDLAVAFHRSNQPKEALQALETSLRHDGTRSDAWVMLFELAKAVGADETAREALAALRECAPYDPRIPALSSQV